jgi:hypothetical protein
MNCAAAGELSLVALVPAGSVADPPEGTDELAPVIVHVTVCRQHVREARRWLQARSPDEVTSGSTEYVLREWGQMVALLGDTPVWRPAAEARGGRSFSRHTAA